MPKYKYTGRDEKGHRKRGSVEAVIADDARLVLAERGLRSVSLHEDAPFWKFQLRKAKVKRTELIHFSRQLAAFVRAGVPILDSIETLRVEARNTKLRSVLEGIDEALRTGRTFSESISRYPDVFPNFYVAILRSAELTGQLDTVLDQLARYLERDELTRRRVRSALMYPAIVALLACVAVAVLVSYALPKFKDFFNSFDATLPITTRILLSITDFLTEYGAVLVAGLLVVGVLLGLYFASPRGRRLRDKTMLRLPVVGGIIEYTIVERFCRIIAATVRAGVPAPESMAVASSSLGNVVFESAVDEVRDAMMRGEGMAAPITRTGLFPGVACQMMRVGEETGTLDAQLETAAEYFSTEAEYRIDRFTSLLEPTVVIIVGIVVGFVALALVQAMYGIYNQVNVN